MAYVIMCVEAWLQVTYPDRDWAIVSETMWKATEINWGDWADIYVGYIPHVLLSYEEYGEDLSESFSEDIYNNLIKLYSGITSGNEDDPDDVLDYMLTKPHEMAMVYEGTRIGDGHESIEIIEKLEMVLNNNGIPLPDYQRLYFSNYEQLHGWGNNFDGRFLSIVLSKQ